MQGETKREENVILFDQMLRECKEIAVVEYVKF